MFGYLATLLGRLRRQAHRVQFPQHTPELISAEAIRCGRADLGADHLLDQAPDPIAHVLPASRGSAFCVDEVPLLGEDLIPFTHLDQPCRVASDHPGLGRGESGGDSGYLLTLGVVAAPERRLLVADGGLEQLIVEGTKNFASPGSPWRPARPRRCISRRSRPAARRRPRRPPAARRR